MIQRLWHVKKTIILILTPLIFLPVPFVYISKAGRCAYALAVIAVYWMTEALPMAVTALLPIVLMPWLGIESSKKICMNYLKDTNVLFLGGLMLAVAVEKWNLHKRIALRVLLLVGAQPRWLMFGFMSTTAFLSMWISNTATTAMMVPTAHAVLVELSPTRTSEQEQDKKIEDKELKRSRNEKERTVSSDIVIENESLMLANGTHGRDIEANDDSLHKRKQRQYADMCKGLALSVCYAANIGGTGTLTGAGPNMIVKGQIDTLFGTEAGVTFTSWFIFAFPNMLLCLFLAWIALQVQFLQNRTIFKCKQHESNENYEEAASFIRSEYRKLGAISFAEAAVFIHFLVLPLMCVSRNPEFIPGWASLLPEKGYVTDAVAAMTIAVSLFIFPSQVPCCFKKKSDTSSKFKPTPALLDWETVQRKLSWGVVLVLGGGFALADACKVSGLSADINGVFVNFAGIPNWTLVLILTTVTAIFTEVTSNVATATIFLPIVSELAITLRINPLYVMLPVAISTSFAFMLPVATPPNAIVYAYGHMKVKDMIKSGAILNIICIGMTQICINTWAHAYFRLDMFPEWADIYTSTVHPANSTGVNLTDIYADYTRSNATQ